MNTVFLKSPSSGEIKEVEATTAALTPLMAHGWHQVPAPVKPTVEPAPAAAPIAAPEHEDKTSSIEAEKEN